MDINTKIKLKNKPSLVINSISNMASLAVQILVIFFLTPIIIENSGEVGYGIWSIVISIVGYYGIMELGLKTTITRFIAHDSGKNDYDSNNKTLSTAFYFFSSIGVFFIFLSFFGAQFIIALFPKIQPADQDNFIKLIWILGLASGLNFPLNVFTSSLIAHEKFIAHNITQIIVIIMRLILTLIVVFYNLGIVGIALAYLAAYIINLILNILLFFVLTPEIKIKFKYFNLQTLKKMIRFGSKTLVMVITNQIRFNIDSFVIARILSVPLVGVYRIASLIIQYLLNFINTISTVLIPRFSKMAGKQEHAEMKQLFLRSITITSTIAFFVSMMTFIFGGLFIKMWVGSAFVDAIPVLWILLIAYALEMAQRPIGGILFAINKHRFLAILSVFEGVVNIALSIFLAHLFGLAGVALGTAIPMLLIKLFIQPIFVCRILHISIFTYLKRIFIPLATAGTGIIIVWYMDIIFNWDGSYLIQAIIAGAVIAIGFVLIVSILFKLFGINFISYEYFNRNKKKF